jgi:hypothetical protein
MHHQGNIDLLHGDGAQRLAGGSVLGFMLYNPSGDTLGVSTWTYDIWEQGAPAVINQGSDIRLFDNNTYDWVIVDDSIYNGGSFVKDVWFELELSPGSYYFQYTIGVSALLEGIRQDAFNESHVWVESAIYTGTDIANWVQFSDSYPDGVELLITTTVPIPGAAWLLGSGLIGIVGVRRKFKK